MSAVAGFLSLERLRALPPGVVRGACVGLAGLVAVASGFAALGESLQAIVFVAAVLLLALLVAGIMHPRLIFALLLANAVIFPAIPVFAGRGVNPIDILLPIALLTTWVLFVRQPHPAAGDRVIEARRRDLVRAGLAYYAVALLSLAVLGLRGHVAEALDSLLVLARSMQAATFFYLVARHARGREGVLFARNAVLGAIFAAAAINLPAVAFLGVARAGSVLVFGTPGARAAASWSIGDSPVAMTNPNELAAACLLAWALLLGLPPRRRRVQALGLVVSFVLLLLTQSRSGLLGWMTFVIVYGLRRGRRKLLLLPLLGAAVVPLLPEEFRGRLLRTVIMQEGSFEAYTSIIRLFGWQAALGILRDNPVIGVGYLGFRHVAHLYNPLGIYLETVENFFLEIAVGMGMIGVAVLTWLFVSCARLGRAAANRSEPGSYAARMGAITPPFLLGIMAGNLTGDNLVGLLNGAQFAIFLALLAQTALDPACRRADAGPR